MSNFNLSHLKSISQLSRLDSETVRSEARIAAITVSQQQISEKLKHLQDEDKKCRDHLQNIRKQTHTAESDLKEIEDKISKNRQKTDMITSQKQLQALDHEFQILSEQKNALEEQILFLFEEESVCQNTSESLNCQLQVSSAEFSRTVTELDTEKSFHQQNISDTDKHRNELLSSLEPQLHSQYTRLKTRYQNPAVFIKDGCCGGCMLTLDNQCLSKVKENLIFNCPHCRRLIYLEGSNE